MNRTRTRCTAFSVGAAALVLLFALCAALPTPAAAALPTPNWMPGFPMLAGPQVILMWAPIPGAVKYHIYLNGKKVAESAAMQHITAAPTEGGEYSFTVTAVDAAGAESPQSEAKIIRIIVVEPPTELAALPKDDRIPVRWRAAQGAMIYDVFKRVKGEKDWQMVASVTETRYEDTQVENGVIYEYSVKSKDNTGKSSGFSEPLEATLFVPEAAEAGAMRLEFKRHSMPAQLVYRADLPRYPTDADICGKRVALSAYELFIIDDVTAPDALWEPVRLLPNDVQFMGLTWDENCELIYVNHTPSGQLWVVDPDGTTGESRGAVVDRFDLPAPPEGPPEDDGTLYYISQNTKGEAITIQKKAPTRASDVAFDSDGNLVIGDLDNNRLLRMTRDGEFLETMLYDHAEEISNAPTWAINKPVSIDNDPEGNIFVASINGIVPITKDDQRLKLIGGGGSIFGTFTSIKGVFLDKQGNLYATDGRAGNIQVFQKHEQYKDQRPGGWVPVYVITNPAKNGNVETLTPLAVMVTDDLKNLIIVESMSKTMAYYNLQTDKADPVELPSLEN